jgi:hypothetical protein
MRGFRSASLWLGDRRLRRVPCWKAGPWMVPLSRETRQLEVVWALKMRKRARGGDPNSAGRNLQKDGGPERRAEVFAIRSPNSTPNIRLSVFSLLEVKVHLLALSIFVHDVGDLRTAAGGSEGLSHAVRLRAQEGKTPVRMPQTAYGRTTRHLQVVATCGFRM